MRCGLLGQAVAEGELRIGGVQLATVEAFRHDVGEIVIDNKELREIDAIGGVGGGGDDEVHVCPRCQRCRPRRVQRSFGFVAASQITGIGAVRHSLKIETAAEINTEVAHVLASAEQIAASDYADCHSRARNSSAVGRTAVDGCVILWPEGIHRRISVLRWESNLRFLPGRSVHRGGFVGKVKLRLLQKIV